MDIVHLKPEEIRRRIITGVLCIILLALLHMMFPPVSGGADREITVFWIETDTVTKENYGTAPVKDFYVNGGEDDGFSESMVLDVYRKKFITDSGTKRKYEVHVLVGQVKVIRLSKNAAVTRITGLTSSDDTPVIRYRTVMLGDYVVPAGTWVDFSSFKTMPAPVPTVSPAVSFPSKVLFELGEAKLKPGAKGALSIVRDMFDKSKNSDILIEGHTCSLGSEGYNLELSRERARSVSDYLVHSAGIPEDRVRVSYYGERYPVTSNATEEGRKKNRRVAIRFLPREEKIAGN